MLRDKPVTDLYLQGLMCRIFQHEIDHLHGKVLWETDEKEWGNKKILDTRDTKDITEEWWDSQ